MDLTIYYFSVLRYLLNMPAGEGAVQNIKILIETDELATVPDAAKGLKLHFTTAYRWIKEGKVFSFLSIALINCILTKSRL